MTEPGPDLRGFLEAAGRSLSEAQKELVGDALRTSALAISDAELEVKAAVSRAADGTLSLQTISGEEVRRGGVNASLLSTVRVSYVAVAGEAAAPAPTRSPGEIVKGVRERPGVAALDKILDGLDVDPVYVPDRGRWLVTVRDRERRVVREMVVSDEEAGDA